VSRAAPAFVPVLVALSGFCSLIYQVVWERTLRYNFGGDSISSALVTAVFLLGLGVGALVFGRWRRRPFAAYALVELGIGLYGLVSFHLLAPLSTVLGGLLGGSIAGVEGLRPIVVVACVAFLLPPCILIGGTGPLIFNCFVSPGSFTAGRIGILYGLNTLGAALGVLAAPFLLLNRFSIPVALSIVAAGNIGLGAAIWLYGRRAGWIVGDETIADRGSGRELASPRFILALCFGSGLMSVAFEVSLFRASFVLNPSSPYNFPIMLCLFLLAMAAGSVVFTRLSSSGLLTWAQKSMQPQGPHTSGSAWFLGTEAPGR
jgi:spermidine synthase